DDGIDSATASAMRPIELGVRMTVSFQFGVIAGLDPAIHLLAKRMDPRVEPAGDEGDGSNRPEYALARELSQIRRRLVLVGRHQVAVPAAEIELLADTDVAVGLGAKIFGPERI